MQKGSTLIFLLVGIFILVGIVGGAFYLGRSTIPKPLPTSAATSQTPQPTVTPAATRDETANWKIYTNSQYGFQITYPKNGFIQDGSGGHNGECGKAINTSTDGVVTLDNFFTIGISNWQGSLVDYLTKRDPKHSYATEAITGSGADEAIEITGLKSNDTPREDQTLAYEYSFYKKGTTLVTLTALQNPGNYGGCLLQTNNDWIFTSLKFI